MARWTVGEGDDQMIIEAAIGGPVSVSIPSGRPILADPGTAEDMRLKIGAAIGTSLGQPDPTV